MFSMTSFLLLISSEKTDWTNFGKLYSTAHPTNKKMMCLLFLSEAEKCLKRVGSVNKVKINLFVNRGSSWLKKTLWPTQGFAQKHKIQFEKFVFQIRNLQSKHKWPFMFVCFLSIIKTNIYIHKQPVQGAASGSSPDSTAVAGETRSLQYTFSPAGATKSFTLGLQYLEGKYCYSKLTSF